MPRNVPKQILLSLIKLTLSKIAWIRVEHSFSSARRAPPLNKTKKLIQNPSNLPQLKWIMLLPNSISSNNNIRVTIIRNLVGKEEVVPRLWKNNSRKTQNHKIVITNNCSNSNNNSPLNNLKDHRSNNIRKNKCLSKRLAAQPTVSLYLISNHKTKSIWINST